MNFLKTLRMKEASVQNGFDVVLRSRGLMTAERLLEKQHKSLVLLIHLRNVQISQEIVKDN